MDLKCHGHAADRSYLPSFNAVCARARAGMHSCAFRERASNTNGTDLVAPGVARCLMAPGISATSMRHCLFVLFFVH